MLQAIQLLRNTITVLWKDLEALSYDVHLSIGGWSISNEGSVLLLGIKCYGQALPCVCFYTLHLISQHMTTLYIFVYCMQACNKKWW